MRAQSWREDQRQWFERKFRRRDIAWCWRWRGAIDAKGYGLYWDGARCVRAHRMAYELYRLRGRRFPEHSVVIHTCGNRACVNPHHLDLKERVPVYSEEQEDEWDLMEVEDRLEARVLPSPGDGCPGWGGKRDSERYPVLLVDGVLLRADELAWEVEFGPVVPGMYLIHECGNRECVRVEHLNLAEEPERLPRPPRRRPEMAGAANPRARLTGAQADELRRRYAAGEGTQEALGREYGITKSAVCRIVAGQRYRGDLG